MLLCGNAPSICIKKTSTPTLLVFGPLVPPFHSYKFWNNAAKLLAVFEHRCRFDNFCTKPTSEQPHVAIKWPCYLCTNLFATWAPIEYSFALTSATKCCAFCFSQSYRDLRFHLIFFSEILARSQKHQHKFKASRNTEPRLHEA